LYLAQLAPTTDTHERDARAAVMLDAGPELRALYLAQEVNPQPWPPRSSAPLGMNDDRFALHRRAQEESSESRLHRAVASQHLARLDARKLIRRGSVYYEVRCAPAQLCSVLLRYC
jgi:hypothetical protein